MNTPQPVSVRPTAFNLRRRHDVLGMRAGGVIRDGSARLSGDDKLQERLGRAAAA